MGTNNKNNKLEEYTNKLQILMNNAKKDGIHILPYAAGNKEENLVTERGVAVYKSDNEINYIPTWYLDEDIYGL